jgi:protein-disulfide isomerase
LLEVIDYECPYCRAIHPTIDSLARASNVRIAIIHFPLPGHSSARWAARVAICAEATNQFDQIHRFLMVSEAWVRDTNVRNLNHLLPYATLAGLDRCIKNPATHRRLEHDIGIVRALNVRGTPAFITRTTVVEGVQAAAVLASLMSRGG